MKLLAIASGTLLCFSAQAFNAEECLRESLEVAITLKIAKLSDGDCSKLGFDEFSMIENERISKKSFTRRAIRKLQSGEKIANKVFSPIHDRSPAEMLDNNTICPALTKEARAGLKEVMKECPEGAENFQQILGKQRGREKISEVSLYFACQRVALLKKQSCRDGKEALASAE